MGLSLSLSPGLESVSVSRMCTSSAPVGVNGGSIGGPSGSMFVSSGMTGPGRALRGLASSAPARSLFSDGPHSASLIERLRRLNGTTASSSSAIRALGIISRLTCASPTYSLALYKVSTPSGIITIRDVPTSTPIPIVETNRSRDGDMENERGSEPARKDLEKRLVWLCYLLNHTHAMAMIVLKVSSMNRPSSILKRVSGPALIDSGC